MKSFNLVVVGLAVAIAFGSGVATAQEPAKGAAPAPAPAAAPSELKDLKAKASYSVGLSIGRQIKAKTGDLNPEQIARGLKDALRGSKPLLTDEQIQQVMQEFQEQQVAKEMGTARAFLATNKAKPGVVTLPSGLQYKVIKAGTGPIPKATDTVTTHYRGTFIDGTEFDSSYKRNEPSSFPVNGVIAGWTEALQKMKVGSKWQLVVPPELGYGNAPRQGIPSGSVLLFDIELLGIGNPPAGR